MASKDFLGQGKHTVVHRSESRPEQVDKESKEPVLTTSATKEKIRFYVTKLAHLCYPELIPNITLAAYSKRGHVRERMAQVFFRPDIRQTKLHALSNMLDQLNDQQKVYREQLANEHLEEVNTFDSRLEKKLNELRSWGIKFDVNAPNFVIDVHRRVKYIDALQVLPKAIQFDRIEAALAQRQPPLTEREWQQAKRFMKRVQSLQAQL